MFSLKTLEKNSGPKKTHIEVRCPGGTRDFPLSCLIEYSSRTESKRAYFTQAEAATPARLFIANTKPYQAVTPSTLAKWLPETMDRAGIDTALYKAHSARSASASDMLRQGVSLQQILQRAVQSTEYRVQRSHKSPIFSRS